MKNQLIGQPPKFGVKPYGILFSIKMIMIIAKFAGGHYLIVKSQKAGWDISMKIIVGYVPNVTSNLLMNSLNKVV